MADNQRVLCSQEAVHNHQLLHSQEELVVVACSARILLELVVVCSAKVVGCKAKVVVYSAKEEVGVHQIP